MGETRELSAGDMWYTLVSAVCRSTMATVHWVQGSLVIYGPVMQAGLGDATTWGNIWAAKGGTALERCLILSRSDGSLRNVFGWNAKHASELNKATHQRSPFNVSRMRCSLAPACIHSAMPPTLASYVGVPRRSLIGLRGPSCLRRVVSHKMHGFTASLALGCPPSRSPVVSLNMSFCSLDTPESDKFGVFCAPPVYKRVARATHLCACVRCAQHGIQCCVFRTCGRIEPALGRRLRSASESSAPSPSQAPTLVCTMVGRTHPDAPIAPMFVGL